MALCRRCSCPLPENASEDASESDSLLEVRQPDDEAFEENSDVEDVEADVEESEEEEIDDVLHHEANDIELEENVDTFSDVQDEEDEEDEEDVQDEEDDEDEEAFTFRACDHARLHDASASSTSIARSALLVLNNVHALFEERPPRQRASVDVRARLAQSRGDAAAALAEHFADLERLEALEAECAAKINTLRDNVTRFFGHLKQHEESVAASVEAVHVARQAMCVPVRERALAPTPATATATATETATPTATPTATDHRILVAKAQTQPQPHSA